MTQQRADYAAHRARLRDQALEIERTGSGYATPHLAPETPLLTERQYRIHPTCVPGTAPNGDPAYVKTIELPPNLAPGEEAKQLRRISDQLRVGMALSGHSNHVDLLDYTDNEPGKYRLYYSVAPGDTVEKRVQNNNLTVHDACIIARDVATGLAYAHDPNRNGTFDDPIIHGDVTAGNIMYDGERARLIDHGASVLEVFDSGYYSTRQLTPGWAAPEVNRGEGTTRSDVFGLGMLVVHMITGEKPSTFFDYNNALDKNKLNTAVRFHTSQTSLIDLVERCTKANPQERPTAQEVVNYVKALLPGVVEEAGLATQVAAIPSEIRKGWNVPSEEATVFADYTISGNRISRDDQKIAALQYYLETEPVSQRDRAIIGETIRMIRAGKQNRDISDYLECANKEQPELIFGYTRAELSDIGQSSNRSYNINYNIKTIQENPVLASLIEYTGEHGISIRDLCTIFRAARTYSKQGQGSFDKEKYTSYLSQIRKGLLEDRVSALQEKYKETEYTAKDLKDPRYQALFMVMEDEGLTHAALGEPNRFQTFSNYGFGLGLEERPSTFSETYFFDKAMFGAIGGGILSPVGVIALYKHNMLHLLPGFAMMDDKLSFFISSIVAGFVGGGLLTYAAARGLNSFFKWKDKDTYFGSIDRSYLERDLLEAVYDLITTIPRDRIKEIVPEIEELGKNKEYTPVHVIQSVKEILSARRTAE